jgi:beta-lysine 5,6-aminomutase beta subunit
MARHLIRPYGDRQDDGAIQLSFTLPVAPSGRAKEAARRFAERLGLKHVLVTTMEPAGRDFSFFVVYGRSEIAIDLSEVTVPEVAIPERSAKEINHLIEEKIGRRVVVVGACTGADAHTVGIDAILNMKGYAGDKGLEAYPWIDAHNLGAQVDNPVLLTRARELGADAVLVSQVITQRDCHKENAAALMQLVRKEKLHGVLWLLGGPRIDHALARELGFDAGFGPGTKPSQVASYIVDRMVARKEGRG